MPRPPVTVIFLIAASFSLAGPVPARAQEELQLASEQPQFSSETVPLYRVERTHTLLVETRGRARALVLNPEAVEVDSVSDNHIIFRGLRIDSSLVHLLEDSGRRTVRIEVTELTSILTEIEARKTQAVREKLGVSARGLKFRYRGEERHLERGKAVSMDNANERHRIRTHDLAARMGTPLGEFLGKAYLEQRRDADLGKEVTQPRHLSAELRKINLGVLGPSDLVAGDRDLILSEYTIDGRRYRGFGLFPSTSRGPYLEEQPALDRRVAVSAFGGEEREGFGLDLPSGLQTRKARSHFAGAKVAYGLWETGHLYITDLHRYSKGGEMRSDHVAAAGFNTAWAEERLLLKGEAARNGPEGAYEVETRTQLPFWLKTRNRFWRAGKNYKTVTGQVAEDGQTGWKGWAGADLKVLDQDATLFVESIIYRDRNAVNPVNPREINTLYTMGGSADLPGRALLQGSATYEDQSASPLPYVNQRQEAELSRETTFPEGWTRAVTPFAGYRHSIYDKSGVPGFDATLDLYRTGVRASFAGGFWATASWSQGRLEEEKPETLPAVAHPKELVLEVGKNHAFRAIPATLNLSVRYEDVQETLRKTHQPFADRNRFAVDGRFSWKIAKDKEAFAELSLSRQKPETGGGSPIVDILAQFGVQLLWDTGWAWTQKGCAAGEVFKDLNGNGRREPDEPGLHGIRVTVEGGPEDWTGADGDYRLKGIPEGPAVIRVDADQIPPGYFFTTPNIQEKLILPRRESRVDFGVSTEVEFRGVVFNDLDEDLAYREGTDRPVQGVRMTLESGQGVSSGPDGFYSIRKAAPGEHTLSADLSTIPDGYRTLVPVQETFQTKEGEILRRDLPLKAQRNVSGAVYVDADGNSSRSAQEKGIEGIRIRLDGQQAMTDAGGAYRFSNVQPGRYTVRADARKVPAGYRFASAEPKKMEVPEGPFTRERFDFPVVPMDGEASSAAPLPLKREKEKVKEEGEISVREFLERFPSAAQIPEGANRIYLMPASRGITVSLYVQETLRSALEQAISRESAGLAGGLRVQVLPVPASESGLKRPGLIVRDWMLEPPPLDTDLGFVDLTLGRPVPPLAALVLEGLRGESGERRPEPVIGITAARDSEGELYWIWFLK